MGFAQSVPGIFSGRIDHMNVMIATLTNMAAPHLDGGYVAASLLDMSKRSGAYDNTTVAVIDLLHGDDDTN
ncbi:hypothetical protein AB0O28_36715 [Microbispora sp. NPDC088329]|uniref:hypothetical protein n=1 Tax=Microbispora sp. NPDC088329 TaxID=3154869 RepID=UPI0034447205